MSHVSRSRGMTVAAFRQRKGGEPLVNFPVVKHVIEYAHEKNRALGKHLEFTMVSNLALMDEDKLGYLLESDVVVAHKDELLFVAINEAKAMFASGYRAPHKRSFPVAGRSGIATITAARIYEGQKRGETGEENQLSFEKFPNVNKELGPEMKSTGEAIYFIKDLFDPYFRQLYKDKSMFLSR